MFTADVDDTSITSDRFRLGKTLLAYRHHLTEGFIRSSSLFVLVLNSNHSIEYEQEHVYE